MMKNLKLPSLRRSAAGIRRLSARQIILWGGGLILAVGVFLGVKGFTACWRLTALQGIPLTSCGGTDVNPLGTPVVNAAGTPVGPAPPEISAPEVQYPQWDGGSRINIAFFGLRGGENAGEECPNCTDTIIVSTVDPVSKTAGMISVPRDMYVNIPGSPGCNDAHDGYCRINTAWRDGIAYKLPGGGPGEAMLTVSQFLGVPIQYYVQVDFDTFVEMIKMIGGVDIYNDEDLVLDRVGSGTPVTVTGSAFGGAQNISITFDGVGMASSCRADAGGSFSCRFVVPASTPGDHSVSASNGTRSASATFTVGGGPGRGNTEAGTPAGSTSPSISLDPAQGLSANDKVILKCCGMRHLSGTMALAYARGRHTANGDVDRSSRQQKLILAIRDKVFDPQNFTNLMTRAPQLYSTLSAGIHTNISLEDAIKLAALFSQIPPSQIRHGVMDEHAMTNPANVTLGGQNASILIPVPDKIRELRDEIFTTGGPTSPIAQGDPRALMQADGATIALANNTYTVGLETHTYNFLEAQGMNVVGSSASTGVSDLTVVVVHSPKLYALRYLMQLGVIAANNSHQIVFQPDPTSKVDLEIRLGNDWVSKLPPGN
jgi:LCP family protein required for cell wall assembly